MPCEPCSGSTVWRQHTKNQEVPAWPCCGHSGSDQLHPFATSCSRKRHRGAREALRVHLIPVCLCVQRPSRRQVAADIAVLAVSLGVLAFGAVFASRLEPCLARTSSWVH